MTRRDILRGAVGATTFAIGPAVAASREESLSIALAGTGAAFVIRNLGTGETLRHEPELAAQPKSPFSTFKIWNAAIAFDVGVISDLSFRLDWDAEKHPAAADWPEDWKRPHDVKSAFKVSAVWFFREIALRIGPERMGAALRQIGYGNADISGGIDRFWINSSLRITAEDQVERLADLIEGRTSLSSRTVKLVQEVMEIERGRGTVFSGKTGGGPAGNGYEGWFVGTLTRPKDRYAFATFLQSTTWEGIGNQRLVLTREALAALGLRVG